MKFMIPFPMLLCCSCAIASPVTSIPNINGFNIGAHLSGNGSVEITLPPGTATPDSQTVVVTIFRKGREVLTKDAAWNNQSGLVVKMGDPSLPVQNGDTIGIGLRTNGVFSGYYSRFSIPKEPYTVPIDPGSGN